MNDLTDRGYLAGDAKTYRKNLNGSSIVIVHFENSPTDIRWIWFVWHADGWRHSSGTKTAAEAATMAEQWSRYMDPPDDWPADSEPDKVRVAREMNKEPDR